MTDWQPIETAPKDEMVLVWEEDGWVRCAELVLMSDFGGYEPDEWDDGGVRMWIGDDDRPLDFDPSHWMPLPPPPKKENE